MRSRLTLGLITLCFALCGIIGVQQVQKHRLRDRVTVLSLDSVNTAAAADTTRRVSATSPAVQQAVSVDSAVYQRQVIQRRQIADATDRALQLERVARQQLAIQVDSLKRLVTASTPTQQDSLDVRRASFAVRTAPYTVRASVELPAPPDTGRMALAIALDAIPLTARLSCSPPNHDGIRSASIETTVPRWASVSLTDVEQSPDVCRSPALERKRPSPIRPAFVVGLGRVTTPDGRSAWGGFVGGGLAIGR